MPRYSFMAALFAPLLFSALGHAACTGMVTSSTGTSADGIMSNSIPNVPFSSGAHKFVNGMTAGCDLQSAQPDVSDITGLGTLASENANAVSITGGTITGVTGLNGSGAVLSISFQPGTLSGLTSGKSVPSKFVKASVVDNIIASALLYTCIGAPTVTLYECGTSATCAAPTAIGSVTLSAAGTASTGTVSNPAIAAGDFVMWAVSGGTCVTLNVGATAQAHAT